MRYLFILLTIFFLSCGQNSQSSSTGSTDNTVYSNPNNDKDNKVYVCVSNTAYAYHRNRQCKGLKRCTHRIESMTEEIAKSQYKRKPCGYCY